MRTDRRLSRSRISSRHRARRRCSCRTEMYCGAYRQILDCGLARLVKRLCAVCGGNTRGGGSQITPVAKRDLYQLSATSCQYQWHCTASTQYYQLPALASKACLLAAGSQAQPGAQWPAARRSQLVLLAPAPAPVARGTMRHQAASCLYLRTRTRHARRISRLSASALHLHWPTRREVPPRAALTPAPPNPNKPQRQGALEKKKKKNAHGDGGVLFLGVAGSEKHTFVFFAPCHP
jgi:hypothetical protein